MLRTPWPADRAELDPRGTDWPVYQIRELCQLLERQIASDMMPSESTLLFKTDPQEVLDAVAAV
jgi:hypothetical protein